MACPACRGAEVECETCRGARRLKVDLAVQWAIEHGSKPPGSTPQASPSGSPVPGDSDAVLLNAIYTVLHQLGGVEQTEQVTALTDRAKGLKALVLTWSRAAPSQADREAVAKKVLGLHVALGRLPCTEKS